MEQTKLTKGLMEALCKWQADKPQIDLDGNNPHFKSKYATLANIINKVKPALKDCGLTFTQIVSDNKIITMLLHPESEGYMISERPLPEFGKVQDEGSFITYQKRYQLCAMLGIAGEDDNDGNGVATATNALPACTDKMIEALITGKQKGLPSGNRQAVEMLYGSTRMTVAQLRKLFMAELFAFEELMVALIERMESDGYEVKKVS